MAINLISKEDQDLKKINKAARLVKVVTTVVMLGYVTGIAAISGWWITIFNKGQIQSVEEKQLVESLNKLANEEIVFRQLDLRAKAVNQVLGSRVEIATKLKNLLSQIDPAVTLLDWNYGAGGIQTLSLRAGGPMEIENFVNKVKGQYKIVELVGLSRKDSIVWEAKLSVSDGS
jgi:hypothetical protein